MATLERIKVESSNGLDAIDRKILSLLQDNAKMAQAEVAKEVGLTAPSVNERIRKLERAGYIRAYVAITNSNPKPFVWTKTADQILESVAEFCVRTSDSHH